MSTIALPQPRAPRAPSPARRSSALAARPELLVLLVVAGALNLWALGINGYANDYYSAAVRSMTTSWHAFLYGAFDAAGAADGRQAAAGAVGAGAVGAGLRVLVVVAARAAGADGDRDRRAGL